jgi:hypothetical protein
MDTFAVQVFPIADLDAWKSFADEISSGGRKDAHRDALRRLGCPPRARLPRRRTGR